MFKYILDYASGSHWLVWHEILHHGVSFYLIMIKIYPIVAMFRCSYKLMIVSIMEQRRIISVNFHSEDSTLILQYSCVYV